MLTNTTQAIREAWNSRVDEYAEMLAVAGQRYSAATTELDVFERHLPHRLLDIVDAGCGPGFHGIRLLTQGHRVRFVDASPRMLECARSSVPETMLERATFLEADIRSLDLLPEASADAVISGGTVISDCGAPWTAISELSRVLTRNGVLGFSVRNLDGPQQRGARRHVIRGGGPGFDWRFFSVESVRELCAGAGLLCREIVPVLLETDVPAARRGEAWRAAAWEMFVIAVKNKEEAGEDASCNTVSVR